MARTIHKFFVRVYGMNERPSSDPFLVYVAKRDGRGSMNLYDEFTPRPTTRFRPECLARS